MDFTDHILTRWRRLLSVVGAGVDDGDLYATFSPPEALRGFTVVHIGAGSPARLWPENRWATVVRHLVSAGHRIVLTGSDDEASQATRVCEAADLSTDQNHCGRLEIMEITGLVAGARFVTCVDTGMSHLATAFRRPALTLYGPLPPAWWGPPRGNPQHRTLWAGRIGDPYSATTDPGLLEISAADVVRVLDELHEAGM